MPVFTAVAPASASTDAELLQAVLAHAPGGWEELLRRFRGLMYRCISKVLVRYEAVLCSEDADEVFAEVCLNLLRDDMRKLRAYDAARGSRLGSWIGLIAINTAYDFLRVTARRPMVDILDRAEEIETEEQGPLEALMEKERWTELRGMITGFSERDRHFVELYYARGMVPEAIAGAMGISVKTVYSKKNKIRSRLQRIARHETRAA
jgi:RNA polymerase sigma-70 factor (ECF subfamily)